MLSSKLYDTRRINATQLCLDRERIPIDSYVSNRLIGSSAFIDRLELECTLNGHDGCVNCLEWSSDGRILASGSDDLHIILWDPFKNRQIHSLRTKHTGNVFSVKFLPRQEEWIATCAADKYVYVYDINRPNETMLSCHCHSSRVKRLATAIDSPHIFWSAGEDGAIFQFDLRDQHRCHFEDNCIQLINLATYLDASAEAKCIAINPMRTEYLAVGGNNPYARIYDRRMLKPNRISAESVRNMVVPEGCVQYFCPGQISKSFVRYTEQESHTITYLTFNQTGTELLVNMGGEHVYVYDINKSQMPRYLDVYPTDSQSETQTQPQPDQVTCIPMDTQLLLNGNDNGNSNEITDGKFTASNGTSRHKIPEHIEAYKKRGNEYLEKEMYLRAIDEYSEAISLSPDCSVLYLNRATAYMRRSWFGDVYNAIRDCHEALRLDPSYIKARFRLARALLHLGRYWDAEECLKELINLFPNYANNHGVLMLHKDIKESRQTKLRNEQATQDFDSYDLHNDELHWRSESKDYTKRFVGPCNITTDIKEANFFGKNNEFVVAGSDDGNFFIWEYATGKIRSIHKADPAIVNCVQPHPTICMMATSGIDHDIKIWSPIAESNDKRPNLISNIDKTVEENQKKMKVDPFDLHTRSAFCWNG